MYGQELQNLDHFNPIALKMAKTLLAILSARGLNLIQLNYKYWNRNTKIKQSTSRSDCCIISFYKLGCIAQSVARLTQEPEYLGSIPI